MCLGAQKNVVEWHWGDGHNVSKTAQDFSINRKRAQEWNSTYNDLLLNNVGPWYKYCISACFEIHIL